MTVFTRAFSFSCGTNGENVLTVVVNKEGEKTNK
jgi:hypothetical protein